MFDWTPLMPIGAGLIRSVAGWLENALEDKKISPYEWGQLGATIVRVGLISVALTYIPVIEWSLLEASATAFVADWVFKRFSK